MTTAHRQFARVLRLGFLAVLAVGALASAAAASTPHATRQPRDAACADVAFKAASDDIAFNIRAVGVSCATGHAVVQGASSDNLRPGPNRAYRAGTFACRGTFVKPVGKWYEHYVCRSDRGRVVFDRG